MSNSWWANSLRLSPTFLSWTNSQPSHIALKRIGLLKCTSICYLRDRTTACPSASATETCSHSLSQTWATPRSSIHQNDIFQLDSVEKSLWLNNLVSSTKSTYKQMLTTLLRILFLVQHFFITLLWCERYLSKNKPIRNPVNMIIFTVAFIPRSATEMDIGSTLTAHRCL